MALLSTIVSTRHGNDYSLARRLCRVGQVVLLVVFAGLQGIVAADEIDSLLLRDEAPRGIVFEIVESDETALTELLPRIRRAILQIRARFPQTEFAVVSHGREEFALQRKQQREYAQVHQQVQSLVAEDVPVHVCANHAGWYGVTAEDFPDYVSVAPTGQGQIAVYQQLGYDLIVIDSYN